LYIYDSHASPRGDLGDVGTQACGTESCLAQMQKHGSMSTQYRAACTSIESSFLKPYTAMQIFLIINLETSILDLLP